MHTLVSFLFKALKKILFFINFYFFFFVDFIKCKNLPPIITPTLFGIAS